MIILVMMMMMTMTVMIMMHNSCNYDRIELCEF